MSANVLWQLRVREDGLRTTDKLVSTGNWRRVIGRKLVFFGYWTGKEEREKGNSAIFSLFLFTILKTPQKTTVRQRKENKEPKKGSASHS